MPIELKISGDSWPEVRGLVLQAADELNGEEGEDADRAPATDTTKRAGPGRPKKAAAAGAAQAAAGAAGVTSVAAPSAAGSGAAVPSLDDLRAVVKKLHDKVGYAKMVERFQAIAGVKASSDVKPENRADAIAKLEAEIGGGAAASVGEGMI